MVVVFTVDVNNEMKYNVPSQKRMIPGLVQSPASRHRVFYGLEFLSGVMDWSIGVEPWVELTGAIFFPRPLPSFGCILVKTENEKRRFVMKVQAFCEEKGLRSFLGVFGYAESKNQCWQAEKWLLHHLICIFPRWPPKLRKTSIAAN